jgi:hypothetical protein
MLGYNLGLLPNPTQRLPGWKMGATAIEQARQKSDGLLTGMALFDRQC